MIKPIYLLGTDSLRAPTIPVEKPSPELETLITDMIDTMHGARGIGLAAPQVGSSDRLFVVDVSPMEEDFIEDGIEMPPQPMVFINPQIVEEYGEENEFEEGCLSIPDVQEIVVRFDTLDMTYLNAQFEQVDATFTGILARVIQHEYDHVEGVLFLDHLTAFKRRLLKRKLNDIRAGITEAEYPTYTEELGVILPEPDTEEFE